MQSNWNSHALLAGICNVTDTLEKCLAILVKLNIYLLFDSTFLFWGIIPREIKIFVHTTTYTWMLIAALFVISKSWKYPKCSFSHSPVLCQFLGDNIAAQPQWKTKIAKLWGKEHFSRLSRIALPKAWGQLPWFFSFWSSLSATSFHSPHSLSGYWIASDTNEQ